MTRTKNPLTVESAGRRHYVCGDTYAIKQKLKDAGFRWDPDRKCWWTSKIELAQKFAGTLSAAADQAKDERASFRAEMDRRRTSGLSLPGTACKADEAKRHGGVWDRQLEVWLFPSRDAMAGCKADSAKRRGTTSKSKSGAWYEVPLVGERTDEIAEIVEPGGSWQAREGYKPDVRSLVGTTAMTKRRHKGESEPMTTVGAEAYYLSEDQAEDNGDYRGAGWRIIKYLRPATSEEGAPVAASRAAKVRREELARELDRLVRSGDTLTEKPWPAGKSAGGHAGLAGSSGYIVGKDFVSWVQSSYDDAPRHWRTTDPRAIEIAHELFGVTATNPRRLKRSLMR